jgi:phosphate transport system substrate-binding protein
MANLKRNNDMAVSPIVATLVLIVVAVIGAVAVGTIMGTFSSDVSKQANANGAGSAAQTEIVVAGSTTIDPITQLAAQAYSTKNPGVKITSQAMGSGAGVAAVGSGVADIGAASEAIPAKWTTAFPNLKANLIGYGAISVITNKANPGFVAANLTTGVPVADLRSIFDPIQTAGLNATFTAGALPVYRADGSGTADSFFKNYLGLSSSPTSNANRTGSLGANGNAAMISTVGSTNYAIGFADYGDSVANKLSANTITIVPVQDVNGVVYGTALNNQDSITTSASSTTQKNWADLRSEAKYVYQGTVLGYTVTDAAKYPTTLIRPLYYLTNGVAPSTVQDFISFMTNQPYDTNKKMNIFQETNNFNVADLG